MTELFPSIQPEIEESAVERLPMAKEVAWDFDRGFPIYSGGRPVTVIGAEAVKVWCWRALKTVRFRHDIYVVCEQDRDGGNEPKDRQTVGVC